MSSLISRLYSWATDKANNVKITATKMDAENDQIIAALNRKVLCSSSAPGSPISGQTWFDTTNKVLKIYRYNEWVVVGIAHVGTTAPATAQAGDLFYDTDGDAFYYYNGSSWVSVLFVPTAANALAGSVVQTVFASYRTAATTTAIIPLDNTTPQISEGTEFLTATITPKSATNKLLITAIARLTVNAGNGGGAQMALFNTDFHATNAIATSYINDSANAGGYGAGGYAVIKFYMDAGVTTASTFRLRYGASSAITVAINSEANYAAVFNSNLVSSITIQEIKV